MDENERISGVVKHWDRDKAWGFISTDLDDPDATEYFVHCKEVEGYTDKLPLIRYQTVTFIPATTIRDGEIKPRAVSVKVVTLEEQK